MIEIVKQGDLNGLKGTEEFTCKRCGCVFKADKEDYRNQFSQREMCSWYEIQCPCCNSWVTKQAL